MAHMAILPGIKLLMIANHVLRPCIARMDRYQEAAVQDFSVNPVQGRHHLWLI